MSQPDRPRGRFRTAAVTGVCALGATVAITAGATLLPPAQPASLAMPASGPAAYGETPTTSTGVAKAVKGLQDRLKRLPKDHGAWASLGGAYVQQARLTADPSYYLKAEEALDRSAALAPRDFAVLTGQAALAAGRHEFAEAVRLARRAIAENPYGSAAYGVLADAQTQLGEYSEAREAVKAMMDLKPGISSFTRASYDAELRGDVGKARELLEAALRDAFAPEDVAYCRFYLGELALHAGNLERAGQMYDEALRSFPGFVPALAGRARVAALNGHLDQAASDYATVVARLPLSQYVMEYGEVLTRLGKDPGEQWALLRAQKQLMAASGVRDDLTWAEFEADHGSPAEAVRHAKAEYARNPNLVAADALAWALHKAGKPREALPYAKKATARGWRNALPMYHRSVIEHALGRSSTRSASQVKVYNPRFDPKLPALSRFS